MRAGREVTEQNAIVGRGLALADDDDPERGTVDVVFENHRLALGRTPIGGLSREGQHGFAFAAAGAS